MTTKSIYEKHAAAFSHVSAMVVLKNGGAYTREHVANISFKFPKDGAGRLTVFVHWIGLQMVSGVASGYGYDKKSAACYDAGKKLKGKNEHPDFLAFVNALLKDDGYNFADNLRKNDFTVISVL